MTEPVIAADGHTYEEAALQKWLEFSDESPVALHSVGGTSSTKFTVQLVLSAGPHSSQVIVSLDCLNNFHTLHAEITDRIAAANSTFQQFRQANTWSKGFDLVC